MVDSLSGNASNRNAPGHVGPLVGVVLAAGEGRRLRPLTDLRPKPLCPVGGVALLDLALDRVESAVQEVAVNLHHGLDALVDHLDQRDTRLAHDAPDHRPVHRSVEQPEALGTAGALGRLRGWIDGRGVLVHNADAWCLADLAALVDGWGGDAVRVLITPDPDGDATGFGRRVGLVATLLPWSEVAVLDPVPSGLFETTLGRAWREDRMEVVVHRGPFVDCGTPSQYLAANLAAVDVAGGESIVGPRARVTGSVRRSVIGADAEVHGELDGCVVWEGGVVGPDEVLSGVVRAPGLSPDVEARG
jgi:NDP-sugar pyrophosphorylase family protein